MAWSSTLFAKEHSETCNGLVVAAINFLTLFQSGKRKKHHGSDSSSSGGEISDLVQKLADKVGASRDLVIRGDETNRPYSCTHHLCMHIRIDMIKAMSHPGISGGKQIKFANTSNHSQVPLFSQIKTMILVCKMYKIIEFLLTVMTSTLFTWPLWRFNSIPYWP